MPNSSPLTGDLCTLPDEGEASSSTNETGCDSDDDTKKLLSDWAECEGEGEQEGLAPPAVDPNCVTSFLSPGAKANTHVRPRLPRGTPTFDSVCMSAAAILPKGNIDSAMNSIFDEHKLDMEYCEVTQDKLRAADDTFVPDERSPFSSPIATKMSKKQALAATPGGSSDANSRDRLLKLSTKGWLFKMFQLLSGKRGDHGGSIEWTQLPRNVYSNGAHCPWAIAIHQGLVDRFGNGVLFKAGHMKSVRHQLTELSFFHADTFEAPGEDTRYAYTVPGLQKGQSWDAFSSAVRASLKTKEANPDSRTPRKVELVLEAAKMGQAVDVQSLRRAKNRPSSEFTPTNAKKSKW